MLGPPTLSIVATDVRTGEFGVAVLFRCFAAGAVVPHARAGGGAVATFAWCEPTEGAAALNLMAAGYRAVDTSNTLIRNGLRGNGAEIGLVDRHGQAAAHTGHHCIGWVGHLTGSSFCCLGNQLEGKGTLSIMATTFESSLGPLPERILAAVEAGAGAGGQSGGQRSAALYVARAEWGVGWQGDRYIDIRVDDHTDPVQQLGRLLRVHRASLWGRLVEPVVVLDTELIQFVQTALERVDHLKGESRGRWDQPTREALEQFSEASR